MIRNNGHEILKEKSKGVDFSEVEADVGGAWDQTMAFYHLIKD